MTRPTSGKNFAEEMNALKFPSKYLEIFDVWAALISWSFPSFHEGTNIYSWRSTTYVKCLQRSMLKYNVNPSSLTAIITHQQVGQVEGIPIASDTAYKTPHRVYPIQARVRKTFNLPIELEHKSLLALKHANFDLRRGDHTKKFLLNELNELRDHAYENSLIYKEKTKRIHDSKIKNRVFNVGDQVLLFNSRLKMFSGKLKSRWSGPFTIAHVFPYGTVELSQNSGPNFKVNGHRIKHYFGGDVPKLVVPDLQTFPKDK
ncbi:hypothetical protein Tco_1062149 [Tanacetum coccineum]